MLQYHTVDGFSSGAARRVPVLSFCSSEVQLSMCVKNTFVYSIHGSFDRYLRCAALSSTLIHNYVQQDMTSFHVLVVAPASISMVQLSLEDFLWSAYPRSYLSLSY